jgi:pseudaminic acid biosynthesis-associated methylase
MNNLNEQELLWSGDFGNAYIDRNRDPRWVASNLALFSRVLQRTSSIRTVLELGSNIGLNLRALRTLLPDAGLSAVEINENAAAELKSALPEVDVHVGSILEFKPRGSFDLVFTKGVLIHIAPNDLATVYKLMYDASARYLLVCEYYNPSPTEVIYRGRTRVLFKRDFAGELIDLYQGLRLVDYGFVYRRDPQFPQDDMNWFLLEK